MAVVVHRPPDCADRPTALGHAIRSGETTSPRSSESTPRGGGRWPRSARTTRTVRPAPGRWRSARAAWRSCFPAVSADGRYCCVDLAATGGLRKRCPAFDRQRHPAVPASVRWSVGLLASFFCCRLPRARIAAPACRLLLLMRWIWIGGRGSGRRPNLDAPARRFYVPACPATPAVNSDSRLIVVPFNPRCACQPGGRASTRTRRPRHGVTAPMSASAGSAYVARRSRVAG